MNLRTVRAWSRSHFRLRLLLAAAVVFIPIWLVCYITIDNDFGWHLQAGNYFRAHGIPAHDVFSFTARGFEWIDHEWLSDIILSIGYQIGGYLTVSLITAGLWTIALLLAVGRRANLMVLLLAAVALLPFTSVRPTAVSALLFGLLLYVMRRPQPAGRWTYWWLPLLFVAWANLHAGFTAGLALIGYYALARRSKRLLILAVICGLATLLNVYGIRLYEEIIRTVFDRQLHSRVQEWYSFYITPPSLLYVGVWLGGFLLFQKPFFKRFFELGPILLLASLSAARNLPLFVLATAYQLQDHTLQLKTWFRDHYKRPSLPAFALLTAALVILLGSIVISVSNSLRLLGGTRYPVASVAYLRQHPCPGNVYNNFSFGGYLIWQLPQSPVYIDGRMPSWEPYMTRYEQVSKQPGRYYRTEFKTYTIRCAVLSRSADRTFIQILQADGWKPVAIDEVSLLLVAPGVTTYAQ